MSRVIFLMLVLFISCSVKHNSNQEQEPTNNQRDHQVSINELNGTKWSYKIVDGCINTYHFKPDSQYVFYSCEMEDTYYGRFFVKEDTLHLYEYITAADSLLPSDSPHRSEKTKFKVIMVDGKLKHIARLEEVEGFWKKSNFSFPENYLYVKER